MDEAMKNDQVQTCPQCDNHCPVDALQCGRGRKYFSVTEGSHEHEHDHEHSHEQGCYRHGHPKSGLAGLLHQCGRFARHADIEEAELFRALTDEEKATLQALLEKLSVDWKAQFGEETFSRCGHGHHDHDGEKHHHKHEGRGK